MTDAALAAKKLAQIESCVSDLRRLARVEAMASDLREQRFIEHTLQIAIQAALDVASPLKVVAAHNSSSPHKTPERMPCPPPNAD